MKLYTHLNFGGNCEAAFRYYEQHLGGRITMLLRVRDLPPEVKPPPGSPDAVIHARLASLASSSSATMCRRTISSRSAAPTCTSRWIQLRVRRKSGRRLLRVVR